MSSQSRITDHHADALLIYQNKQYALSDRVQTPAQPVHKTAAVQILLENNPAQRTRQERHDHKHTRRHSLDLSSTPSGRSKYALEGAAIRRARRRGGRLYKRYKSRSI